MKRIVKDPKQRRKEILEAAGELIRSQGYDNTTVEAIIQKAGVAKGTFYYYFKSKEDILDALVQSMVNEVCEVYKKIADDPKINAINKMQRMLRGENQLPEAENGLMDDLHQPENRELHERLNVEIIMQVAPVFAQVIEQGKEEGVFDVKDTLATIQFLLAGSQFLLESDLFDWNQEEEKRRIESMQAIIERSLGAKSGTFSFI